MGFTQGGVSRRTAGHFLTSMRRRRVPGSGGFMSRAFKWSMELCLVRRTNKPQVHTGFLFPVEKKQLRFFFRATGSKGQRLDRVL